MQEKSHYNGRVSLHEALTKNEAVFTKAAGMFRTDRYNI